jgi:hypothetical protein
MSTAIKNLSKTVNNSLTNGCSAQNPILCCQPQQPQQPPQQNGTGKVNGTAPTTAITTNGTTENGHGPVNGVAKKVGAATTNGVVKKAAAPPSAKPTAPATKKPDNSRQVRHSPVEIPVKPDQIKLSETENAAIKLADIHMSDITVVNVYKTDEKIKVSPCKTRIVIYRPKDPTKKPTAKVVVEKVVFPFWFSFTVLFLFLIITPL